MKKKLIFTTALASVIGVSFAAGAFAGSNLQTIEAYLNYGLNLKLNGKAWIAKDSEGTVLTPITYNGSTYLPVRAVGEAVGVKIGWDPETYTVLIGEEQPTVTIGSSRTAPAPIGATLNFSKKNIVDNYSGTVKLIQVIRGEAAWQMIQKENMFNSKPAQGMEYVLAKVEVKITQNAKTDAQVSLSEYSFTAVSGSGKDYQNPMVVAPAPAFDAKLYVGASQTGWVALQIATTDQTPLLTIGRNYDGTSGSWFKLY